jgi:uncharacterized protein YigA (DUF484 family)
MPARQEPAATVASLELSEEAVREYLKSHSDFFQHHPDMLDFLHVSHASGSAVSLVEKQVSVLRERNVEMRQRLNALTANARHNDQLYEQTRRLVMALLDARSLQTLCAAFTAAMRDDFEVEHASIILFGDRHQAPEGVRVESAERARIEIGALLRSRKALCGPLREEELNYLFPDAGAVGSAAVMPLVSGEDLGVIAVGSSDAHRYSSSMGTLFLQHIAEVLVRLLPRLGANPSD